MLLFYGNFLYNCDDVQHGCSVFVLNHYGLCLTVGFCSNLYMFQNININHTGFLYDSEIIKPFLELLVFLYFYKPYMVYH